MMAALKLLAKVAVALLVAYVPTVELVQVFDPLVPAVRLPDALVRVLLLTLRKFPGTAAVNVSVELLRLEVTPKFEQSFMAALKLSARVTEELFALLNVPVYVLPVLLQLFELPAAIVNVFVVDPPEYEITIEPPVDELPVNSSAYDAVEPPFDRVKVFDPLVTETVVLAAGVPEVVPTTFAAVPPLLRVRVLEPLVKATWVLAVGVPEVVPTTFAPVPLVANVRVFAPFTTVIAPPDVGGLENVPV